MGEGGKVGEKKRGMSGLSVRVLVDYIHVQVH